jgi:hypothetical protein
VNGALAKSVADCWPRAERYARVVSTDWAGQRFEERELNEQLADGVPEYFFRAGCKAFPIGSKSGECGGGRISMALISSTSSRTAALLCAADVQDPGAHIFTRSKVPWISLPEQTPAYDVYYDMKTL